MRGALALCAAAIAFCASATEVVIETTSPRTAHVTIVAERVDDAHITREVAMTAGESATLDLTPGVWIVHAQTAGLWSPSLVTDVRDTPLHLRLPIHPAGIVRARVEVPRGTAQPDDIRVYFRADDAEQFVRCPVQRGRASCELPAGTYDLAYRIPEHVTLHEWTQTIAEERVHDAGTLRFRRGTTISGWVDLADSGLRDFSSVEVTLNEERVKPTARGFFEFVTSAGRYTLQARGTSARSEEVEVTAVEGRESLLRTPLALQRGRALTVRVVPAVDPTGKPWVITLDRHEQRTASMEGVATFEDVLPATYSVRVGRRSDDAWITRPVDTNVTSELDVTMDFVKVRGVVQLASKPLRARIGFTDGTHDIHTRSVPDGRFSVYLPVGDKDTWERVEIESEPDDVRAVLRDVRIERDADGERTLMLDVAGRGVIGELVDERGRPIDRAVITATTSATTLQRTAAGGTFKLLGLPPGDVHLTAFTADRETAQPYVVRLNEASDDLAAVRLTLAPGTRLRGVIRSLEGPVIGARLWAPPTTLQNVIAPVSSNSDGAFDFALPPGQRDVSFCVAAPGFAFRMLRVPVRSDPPQQVFVRQTGGALVVDAKVTADRRPYIVHDSVLLPAAAFGYLSGARLRDRTDAHLAFDAPLVEEGAYSLCALTEQEAMAIESGAVAPSGCVSTFVASGSSARLQRE